MGLKSDCETKGNKVKQIVIKTTEEFLILKITYKQI